MHLRAAPATTNDVPALLRMVRARFAHDELAFDEDVQRRALTALLAEPSLGGAWLLFSAEEVAGYFVLAFSFALEHGGRIAHVRDLYVLDIFRRHGVASHALHVAEKIARDGGALVLELDTDHDSDAAITLARRNGFDARDRVTLTKRVMGIGALRLVAIDRDGSIEGVTADALESAPLRDVIDGTKSLYEKSGFVRPWIAYVALDGDVVVGTCAFKSPPNGAEVEIAYYTFPAFEGRGIASWMAARLCDITATHDEAPDVIAQTLPKESASTAILKKLGFVNRGALLHPEDGLVWEWRQRKY